MGLSIKNEPLFMMLSVIKLENLMNKVWLKYELERNKLQLTQRVKKFVKIHFVIFLKLW